MRIYETSWEVCNKVGGINTVIKSKAPQMVQHYQENYFLIGPYFENKASVEFTQEKPPAQFTKVFQELEKEGIQCYYGTWNINLEPKTILLDCSGMIGQLNDLKKFYWEQGKIDSLSTGWEFEEPMLFSTAAAKLIHKLSETQNKGKNTTPAVAHFHEWLTGFAILQLKALNSSVKTVFTTHATILGRAIAGSGYELYNEIEHMNPEEWAYKIGIQDKFTAERAAARNAEIFTTVSEITALEAEKILGRKPEVLLYNGLSLKKFPTVEETSIKHATSREKLREFLAYYFYPYYTFPLEHTLMYFITARFEYRNKGLDALVAALKKLNEDLIAQKSDRTICCFFWIPLGTTGVRKDIIENKNTYYHIKNYIDWHAQTILKTLAFDILMQRKQSGLFSDEFLHEIKKDLKHFKREGNPPICTHELINENELLRALREAGLDNREENRVKVVMYPAYLDGADSLLNLPYYEAIIGTHLGIFPSYYEPWGYTPLEAAALAVPAITTDLAGFGRFIKQSRRKQDGIVVLDRYQRSYEEHVEDLYQELKHYSQLDHVERVQRRLAAKTAASLAAWEHFAKRYFRAHELAAKKNT